MDTERPVVWQWSPTPVGLSRFVCSMNLWLNGLLLSPMYVWLLSFSHLTGVLSVFCRAQWLRGRALDSRLREPGFESWLRC